MKKLYRSKTDKMVAGVIGGLGEYFNVDSTILRLGFVFVMLITAIIPCILLYIFAMIIIPADPGFSYTVEKESEEEKRGD